MDLVSRTAAWYTKHTQVLINVWSKYTIFHHFTQVSRNIHLCWEISQRLEESGIHWTLSLCWEQMKHLRILYWRVKPSNSCSRRDPRTCPCYDELHWVLSSSSSTDPEVTHDSSLTLLASLYNRMLMRARARMQLGPQRKNM